MSDAIIDGERADVGAIRAVNIRRKKQLSESERNHAMEQDKLRKDHFMKADSDQIDLDALLQAVLDISDRLHDQEDKLVHSRPKEKQRPRSSYALNSTSKYDDFEDGLSFASDLNSPGRRKHTARPFSAVSASTSKPNDKKNLSFANSKVEEIDRENQRLLKRILRSKAKNSGQSRASGPVKVKSSSEVNRSKLQQQIQSENVILGDKEKAVPAEKIDKALLRRLESVKPTKTLSKDHLMREHFKQSQYSKNVSRSGSRPSSVASKGPTRSSSLSNLSDIDCRSEVSARSRVSAASTRTNRTRCSSARSSLRSGRTQVNAVWEPGW